MLDSDYVWTWVDGSEFSENTFSYWGEGEPNFGNDGVDYCAYIQGHWDDNRCQDQQHEILCKAKKGENKPGKITSLNFPTPNFIDYNCPQ